MQKFKIEDEFWSIFPNAKIGIVISQEIDNSIKVVGNMKKCY